MAETPRYEELRHFRTRVPGEEQRVTNLELFFDLVFVFAVTQLSHSLAAHLTWTGALRTLFLLLIVWWVWSYTTWMTNWLDPERTPVRLLIIGMMIASLLMAIAIPDAFGDRAVLFAAGYVAVQVGRNAFMVHASPAGSQFRLAFARIAAWSVAAGVLFLVGAFLPTAGQVALWTVALALDYAGPYARYWVPVLGASATSDWDIEAGLFAERFQLFMIIALGETIVVTGLTASDLELDAARLTAIVVAVIGTAAFWWLYFDDVARIAGRRLQAAEDAGRLARDAFSYLHIPLVAGIIVAAVGDELVIAHPGEGLSAAELACVAGGPAIYLLGHVALRLRMAGSVSRTRLAAAAACVVVGVAAAPLPGLAVAAMVTGVMVVLIASEALSAHRSRLRGEAGPLEALEASLDAEAEAPPR
jgi:low temperature requirement protein LtrA